MTFKSSGLFNRDSGRLAYQLIVYVFDFSGYIGSIKSWDMIPRCSWPEGTTIRCPQVSDTVVHQHSASNVGGDTNQR